MLHTYATGFKRSHPIVTRNVTSELERRRPEVRRAHDGVAPVDVLGLVAGELHGDGARHRGRSMSRTAVRRRSWRSILGTPAALHAVAHARRKSSRGFPAKRPFRCGNNAGTIRSAFRSRVFTRSTCSV